MEQMKMEFDEKYSSFIETLGAMPCSDKEEKEARFKWFNAHPLHDEMILAMAEERNPKALKNLLGDCSFDRNGEDYDVVSVKDLKHDRKVDYMVLMETFAYVIKNYTGKNAQGEPVKFSASFWKRYRQYAEKEAIEQEYEKNAVQSVSKRYKTYVYKLGGEVKKMKAEGDKRSTKEMVRALLQEKGKQLSENDIETVCFWVEATKISLDEETEETDESFAKMEQASYEIAQEHDEYQKLENVSWLHTILNGSDEQWESIKAAAGKVDFDLMKAFLTRDIMIVLKLYPVSEWTAKEKKQWEKVEVEPKCRDWCLAAKHCKKRLFGHNCG